MSVSLDTLPGDLEQDRDQEDSVCQNRNRGGVGWDVDGQKWKIGTVRQGLFGGNSHQRWAEELVAMITPRHLVETPHGGPQ